MPPAQIVDLSKIDLDHIEFDRVEIEKFIPQTHEMAQLDGVYWYDPENHYCVGYKDITDNEFWIRGHIPGRPIMPGVIMIECAAQLSSFYMKRIVELKGFLGFSGIENAKFRGTVVPGDRLYILGHITKIRSRQFTAYAQGYVEDKMVFESNISGMVV